MYLVGINGGHIRSTAVVYCTLNKKIISTQHGECLNIHLRSHDRTITNAATLLDSSAKSIGLRSKEELAKKTDYLCVAFPGAFREPDKAVATPIFNKFSRVFQKASFVDDTYAGFFAGGPKKNGICVFAGAGTSTGVIKETLVKKLDGRGPFIGDFGSGFQLVQLFLNDLGRRIDKNLESKLLERVRDFCRNSDSAGIPLEPNPCDLQGWFDNIAGSIGTDWRHKFPSLAEPLLAAKTSEEISELSPILDICTKGLAHTVQIALEYTRDIGIDSVDIVLHGGLLRKSALFRECFLRHANLHETDVSVNKASTAVGATIIAAMRFESIDYAQEVYNTIINETESLA